MEIDRTLNIWTAKSLADLRDWRILFEEPWTEAVSRLHCLRVSGTGLPEFRYIYCRTAVLHEITRS